MPSALPMKSDGSHIVAEEFPFILTIEHETLMIHFYQLLSEVTKLRAS
ncbi:MAG: hypothetical protein ABJ084_15615 [Halioglobus sp.]